MTSETAGPQGDGARLADLERRLQLLEDERAISALILAYGPCVDSGSAEATAALWAVDGSYSFQADQAELVGSDGIAAMVRSPAHRRHLQRGCAHVLTAPHVHLDGDRATATCYSLMHHYLPDTGTFQVSRVSANRWELVRAATGWRVAARTNRLLNGDEAARALFASAAREF